MATSHKYDQRSKVWTYGAELEFADWPRTEPLPDGMAIDEQNWTTVNSNGVAADGPGRLYHLGGEILTAPSEETSGPADQMTTIKNRWPETSVNYRTGLNIHIRVPGLREDLKKLQRLQTFIHRIMPSVLPVIDAIPIPTRKVYPREAEFKGAKGRFSIWKRDHQSFLPRWRVELQMKARTPKEFFEAEAIHLPTGKVHWATVRRACVNLRQLLQTDTVEFRHFHMPEPDDPYALLNATWWCKTFMQMAFEARSGDIDWLSKDLIDFRKDHLAWPKFHRYDHWLETGFCYTTRHYHKPDVVVDHIVEWLRKQEMERRHG